MSLSAEFVQCSPCSRCAYTSTAGQKGMLSSSSPSLVKQSWVSTNRFAVYCWPCSAQGSTRGAVPSGAGTGALRRSGQSLNIVFFSKAPWSQVFLLTFSDAHQQGCSFLYTGSLCHSLACSPRKCRVRYLGWLKATALQKQTNTKTPPFWPCLLMRAYSLIFSHFVLPFSFNSKVCFSLSI